MFPSSSVLSINYKASDTNQRYKEKCQALKKFFISIIYENSALCDQITYLQDKILCVKEENNYLSRKLKHIEFIRSTASGSEFSSNDITSKKLIFKRKVPISIHSGQQRQAIKIKKPTKYVKKKQLMTTVEENCQQLIFPVALGDDFRIQNLEIL